MSLRSRGTGKTGAQERLTVHEPARPAQPLEPGSPGPERARVRRFPAEPDDQHHIRILARLGGAFDSRIVRRHNGARILDAVRRYGPISRAALAKRSKLSPPTVSALVDSLLTRRGLLRTVGPGVSSGGRRPVMVDFNAEYGYVAGVDAGSHVLRFGLADLQGRLVSRFEQPTPATSRLAVIDRLRKGIVQLFRDAGIDPTRLFAIGVGAPGMVDVAGGTIISAVNLPGWTDVPLRQILNDAFGVPVAVDNDVNMAALGEMWAGSARRESNFVFLALGAGIGAGIIIDGRLHRGSRWYAGEVGHMNLDHRQWAIDFGGQGYLERQAGAAAIATAGERLGIARADTDGSHALFDAARHGNREAIRVVNQVSVYLGTAIANIATVLDPAVVVVGGGISHAGDLLLDPIRDVASRIVANCPEIRLTALGDDAQLFGSLYSALQLAEVRLFELL